MTPTMAAVLVLSFVAVLVAGAAILNALLGPDHDLEAPWQPGDDPNPYRGPERRVNPIWTERKRS